MTDYERGVVRAMNVHGGSFVRALANAFTYADPDNFAKLRATFTEYWTKYERMVPGLDARERDRQQALAQPEDLDE